MDLKFNIITPVNQDRTYLQLRDIDTDNFINFSLGYRHEYLLSKMTKKQSINRIDLLTRIMVNHFCKNFNLDKPKMISRITGKEIIAYPNLIPLNYR
jgi:hypothetical protein